jgi:sialic acid synthase SpsE
VERIRGVWDAKGVTPQLAVLHCVSSYPAPDEEANLRAIPGIAELGVVPGYSDHTLGIDACVAAVALGAKVIEKHFTIANDYSDFRDHQLSANPEDFAELVKRIRRTEDLLGGVKKVIAPCESAMVERVRRGIAAARDLVAGDRIMAEDLLWLRPRGEFIPGQEKELIGRILRKPVQAGSPFCAADLKAIDA